MFKRIAVACLCCLFVFDVSAENLPRIARNDPLPQTEPSRTTEILTEAAIIAVIIAASIAAYKAMGKPCACPSDTMKNGRACGGNSAYLRPGGYKPLCQVSDINPAMIAAYRTAKTIPGIK